MTLVFKRFHALLPIYLAELNPLYGPNRQNPRLGHDNTRLSVPRTKYITFHAAAPRLWNSLPKKYNSFFNYIRFCIFPIIVMLIVVMLKLSLKFPLTRNYWLICLVKPIPSLGSCSCLQWKIVANICPKRH